MTNGPQERFEADLGTGTPTLFVGTSEMSTRCRVFDWSATPLGPVNGWSQSLTTIVSTLLESRHPMFLWWGPELVQIFNDGYLPSFGTTGRDISALGARGRDHWWDIWPIIGPEIESVLASGVATWHEDHYVPIERNDRRDDVWWTYSYSPVRDDDGSIQGVLVVVQETTSRVLALAERDRLLAAERAARAEAEALRQDAEHGRRQMNELIQQAPAFIAVLRGPNHVFELANDQYFQLVGHRDIIGKPVLDALPEVRDQGYIELLDDTLATGKVFVGKELPLMVARTPNAEPELRHVTFVYQRLVESADVPPGILVHGVDVTDSVKARTELEAAHVAAEKARRDAEEANRAKSHSLAIISHELRTPLTAIGGYAELMKMEIHGPVTDEQRQDLTRIQRSQEYLLGLIDQILDFSRIERGTVSYRAESVSIADALNAAEALVRPQLSAHRVEYVTGPSDSVIEAIADPDKLQQILLNLLANAAKFTDAGGRITTSYRRDGAMVRIDVADTGAGIDAPKLEQIFEPFVQVDARAPRTNGGVGLGLAISRTLARAMGGDISVVSVLGSGSTFTVTLPAK